MRRRWRAVLAGSGGLWIIACGGVMLPEDLSEAGAAGAASTDDAPDGSVGNTDDDEATADDLSGPSEAGVSDTGSGVTTSEVDPNLLMPELSSRELGQFCAWATDMLLSASDGCIAIAGEDSFESDCRSGAPLLCETVAALEQCMRDMASNDCMPEILTSCQELSECGSTGTPTEPVPLVCTPSTRRSCVCPDGSEGAQVCLNDGSGFTPCACVDLPPALEVPYGYGCPDHCPDADCYVPGIGGPGICSRRCEVDADCGQDALCQASGGTGMWCFRRCESDDPCLALQAYSDYEFYCARSYDPYDEYYGWGDGPGRGFCVQTSEP